MALQYNDSSTQYDSSSARYDGVRGFTFQVDDSVTPADTLAKAYTTTKSSSASLTDAVAKAIALSKQGSASLTDALAKLISLKGDFSSISLTDALGKDLSILETSSLSLTDLIGKAFGAGVVEATITLLDASGSDATILRTSTITITDIASINRELEIADTLGLPILYNDSVMYDSPITAYDKKKLFDTVHLLATYQRSFTSETSASDAVARRFAAKRTIAETIGLSDEVTLLLGFSVRPELFATVLLRSDTSSFNLQSSVTSVNFIPKTDSVKNT